jgi:hypothetical protein
MSEDNQPGLTLADLAIQSENVPIGDRFIAVKAISAGDALAIFKRFPKLMKMLSGFDLATFLEVAPEAAAVIISVATGHAVTDSDAEAQAAQIGIETQYDLLEVIGRLTFKNGFGPFVEKIMRRAGVVVPPFVPSGKDPGSSLPQPSKNSLSPDTPQP